MKDPAKKQQLLSGFDMPCRVCKEPSKSQCPSCRTPYCSKSCQRIDWKRDHKNECKELTLEFKRGYNYVEPTTKKKEAPPVVVIPDSVRPTIDLKKRQKSSQSRQTRRRLLRDVSRAQSVLNCFPEKTM